MTNDGNSTHLKMDVLNPRTKVNDSTLLMRMFESQTKSFFISRALSYLYNQAHRNIQGHGGLPQTLTLFQSRGKIMPTNKFVSSMFR